MNKAKFGALVVLTVIGLYTVWAPYAMWVTDDTTSNTALEVKVNPNESRAVAMAMLLMQNQLDHDWVPNNPIWHPSSWLDNMPNYQRGILNVEEQFALGMSQFLGRTRGSSSIDVDLKEAQGKLNYSPDVWYYDSSVSKIGLSATSEEQFEKAIVFLKKYQERLAAGTAIYDVRADSLIATLGLFTNNLGSLTANIEKHVHTNPNGLTDSTVDDIFFFNKGQAYAYYMILRELGKDFRSVITEKKQDAVWDQMLESLKVAAELNPVLVFNGDPDTMFLNSHLMGQGFHILRADKRMKEVMDGLLK